MRWKNRIPFFLALFAIAGIRIAVAGDTGACCLDDACQQLTHSQCTAQGGCFEGNGTPCSATQCHHACCIAGQACVNTNRCDCNQLGGFPPGVDILCADEPCPTACCIPSLPGCFDITSELCESLSGIEGPEGSTCEVFPCMLPCCCAEEGSSCTIMETNACLAQGCTLLTSGSCEEPDCNRNGITDQCDILAGVLIDMNMNGLPDDCEIGACCNDLANEPPFCTSPISFSNCKSGRFLLDANCEDEPFFPPCGIAGCCVPDQPCADMMRAECESLSGLWLLGSTCAAGPESCPPSACLTSTNRCDVANDGTPGCSVIDCCQTVCEQDSFCCDAAWDASCVTIAEKSCRRPCCIDAEFQCARFSVEFCTINDGLPLSIADSCAEPDCNGNSVNDTCDITHGSSVDCNANQIPDDCECTNAPVHFLTPLSGTVDARQPHLVNDASQRQGIQSITVAGTPCVDLSQWSLCETQHAGAPNSIQSVTSQGNCTLVLTLAKPITPGAVTRIFNQTGDQQVLVGTLIAHPSNVNGDTTASSIDILRIIDCLNGISPATNCPWGVHSRDIDHSGQFNPADILRVIDLLNGAGEFTVWNATPRPSGNCSP